MSCAHGNSIGCCDICDEIDAAWKSGEASGKRSVEHCTCEACQITHTNDCAVHNMPAMPAGPCDCGVIPATHTARSGVVRDEDVEAACKIYVSNGGGSEVNNYVRVNMRAALEHFAKGERHER